MHTVEVGVVESAQSAVLPGCLSSLRSAFAWDIVFSRRFIEDESTSVSTLKDGVVGDSNVIYIVRLSESLI